MNVMKNVCAVIVGLLVLVVVSPLMGGWSSPELISELNLSSTERAAYPFLSRDGLTMYFSRRDAGSGKWRLMEAYRETPDGVFTSERVLSELVSTGYDMIDPWVSADELRLYYVEFEASGASRAKMAQRDRKDHSWTYVRVLSELHNNDADVDTPTLTEDELIIVFSSTRAGSAGMWDFWMATRESPDSAFGNIRPLYEINAIDWDRRACIMPDGLTLYFISTHRGEDRGNNIYRATRKSRIEAFGNVERLVVPTPTADTGPGTIYVTPSEDSIYYTIAGGSIYVCYWMEATGVFHVDVVEGNDLNDGSSRDKAFKTIQAGVDMAAEGSTVLVWPGVYEEQVNFRGKAITVQSAGDAAVVRAASGYAFSFHSGEGAGSVLKNFVIRDCEYGIYLTNGASPTLGNLTIVNNKYGVSAFDGSNPRITNCILWGNTYGELFDCQATYSCIQGGSAGEGNISGYPLFANTRAGDYHLRSERGRYIPADLTLSTFDIPVNLSELNDGSKAGSPCISFDGLTLYFSRHVAVQGHVCIVEAYREYADGPFVRQRVVAELANGYNCTAPWVSQDGLRLYYRETQASGTPRIKMAQRPSTADTWTWVRTFDELHVNEMDAAKPSLTGDELTIIFHSTRAGQSDLWMATRASVGESFQNIRPLSEINSSHNDSSAYLLSDGLTLYFTSVGRAEHPGYGIYKCTRASESAPFENVQLITFPDFPYGYAGPSLSSDGSTIYFSSGDGEGIYVSYAKQGRWVLDGITSPCIDAGDPGVDPSGEGMPNGGRINMGAYGGTASASMSEWPVGGDINRDGVVDLSDFAALAQDWMVCLPWHSN